MMNKIPKRSSNERVYGLDAFRAVAIILVVLGHGAQFADEIFWFLPSVPMLNGVDGVELFFVLSGFLIGSILIKKIEKEEKFGLKSIMHFWKRRWFRTLPNYYLILFLNVLFIKLEFKNGDLDAFGWDFIFFT
jgi:peptidoglycan/LPS O-acetylase OafA/YrhL